MKTGNTRARHHPHRPDHPASMEPGHEDREYSTTALIPPQAGSPQWSPVMKTGNTPPASSTAPPAAGLNGARS